MPLRSAAAAASQKSEPILDAIQNLVGGHQGYARRSELDRQWDSIQAATQLRNGRSVFRLHLEARRGPPGPIHKKADRFVLPKFNQIGPRVGIGDGQRCDVPDRLAPDAKALTTGSKNEYAGTGPEDRVD